MEKNKYIITEEDWEQATKDEISNLIEMISTRLNCYIDTQGKSNQEIRLEVLHETAIYLSERYGLLLDSPLIEKVSNQSSVLLERISFIKS